MVYDLFMQKDIAHRKTLVPWRKNRAYGSQVLTQDEFQAALLNALQVI